MKKSIRVVVLLAVVVLIAIAGCGGAAPEKQPAGEDAGAEQRADQAAGSDGGQSDGASGSDDARSSYQTDGRQLIRTGEISLNVTDAETTRDRVRSLVAERDGYVSGSNWQTKTRYNQSWVEGQLTVEIPADAFDETYQTIQTYGDVESASIDTRGVSEQLTDIEARLENLRTQRDRLRSLFEGADDTEAILNVESELAEVQEEIERLEADRRSLQQRVAMSTITVVIEEPVPDPPDSETSEADSAWYDVGITDALGTSLDTLVTLLRASVVLVAYLAPFGMLLGVPVAIAVVIQRRRHKSGSEDP